MDDSENPETASPTSHVKSEGSIDTSFSGSKDGSLKEFPLEEMEAEKIESKSESESDSGLEEGEKERETVEDDIEVETSQPKDRPGLQVTGTC